MGPSKNSDSGDLEKCPQMQGPAAGNAADGAFFEVPL